MERPRTITQATDLLLVAHSLGRIAEQVILVDSRVISLER